VKDQKLREELVDPEAMMQDPSSMGGGGRGGYGREGYTSTYAGQPGAEDKLLKLNRYDFIVQFCWQPKTREERAEIAAQRAAAEKAAAEAAAAAAAAGDEGAAEAPVE
jgi:hypothetical protein